MAAPPAPEVTTIDLDSLRYRPRPSSAAKRYKYFQYGASGITIVETDVAYTGAGSFKEGREYTFPWKAITAVSLKIVPFGRSSLFLELYGQKIFYVYCEFSNKSAGPLEEAIKRLVPQHVREQEVPEWMYSEGVRDIGPELFYRRRLRLAYNFVNLLMETIVFITLVTALVHQFFQMITATPPQTNPVLDSLKTSVQQPIENFVLQTIWPFVAAHYIILAPFAVLLGSLLFPFIGVYLILSLTWTILFHFSFLIFYITQIKGLAVVLLSNISKATGLARYAFTLLSNLLFTHKQKAE